MENLTIAQIAEIIQKHENRKASNSKSVNKWKENHRDEYLERKKHYNKVYQEKKKLKREESD